MCHLIDPATNALDQTKLGQIPRVISVGTDNDTC
jgi:hypothetical protein